MPEDAETIAALCERFGRALAEKEGLLVEECAKSAALADRVRELREQLDEARDRLGYAEAALVRASRVMREARDTAREMSAGGDE